MPKFQNEELDRRYQLDAHFRQRVDRNEAEYRAYLAKANGKTFEIEDSILERFKQEEGHSIYFFYGYMQPHPGAHASDLTLFFLKHFQPEPQEQFVLVYFNNETPSSEYYFEFKNILALLPLRIAEQLKEFILVRPYFYHKAYDYVGLGSISKQFNERYATLDSSAELCARLGITVHDFVSFVPEIISAEFPKNLKRRTSLATYRINLQGQNMTEEQRRQKNQFELSLKALITKEVYKLENYQLGEIGIPIIIQLLIHYFRSKPAGLSEEGIFRKSVSIDEENETLNELSKRNYEYLEHIQNPHLIACLIKRFFTNLKEPLIPYPTYNLLLQDPNKKEHVKQLIKGLPKLNYMTLAFLIEFLKKDVLQHEKTSKMSANNLAICFSPSLMRSEKASMADIVNAGRSVNITNILINNFEQIFGDEQERSVMYKKSAIDRNKDFKNAIKKELDIQQPENHESFGYSTQFRYTKEQIQKQKAPETPIFSEIKPEWPRQSEEVPTQLQATKSQNTSKRQHIQWNNNTMNIPTTNNTMNISMTESDHPKVNSRLLAEPQSQKRIFSRQKNETGTLTKVGSSNNIQSQSKPVVFVPNNQIPQEINQIHFQQQIRPQEAKKEQVKTSSIYFSYSSKGNIGDHQ